jgi:hypothetical protein
MTAISRRAIITGAAASTVAIAVPVRSAPSDIVGIIKIDGGYISHAEFMEQVTAMIARSYGLNYSEFVRGFEAGPRPI